MSAALPAVSAAAIPAAVQAEGPQAVERFKAGLSFERELLTKMLTSALPEESEGEEPQAAGMPETIADAIVSAGGAGLATDLYGATGPDR